MSAMAIHVRECTACASGETTNARHHLLSRALVTAVSVLIVTGAAWLFVRSPRTSPRAALMGAAVVAGRPIEARISGDFSWAPPKPTARDATETANLRLRAAGHSALEATQSDGSAESRHTKALAYLFIDRPANAAELLESEEPRDARVLSDLAAAYLTAAERNDDPAGFAKALTTADKALRINPKLPEALFNRALIIERFGLRDQAREAWKKYLGIDGTSPWADEARQHVRASLPRERPFGDYLAAHHEELASDPAKAHAIARSRPLDARGYGETEILWQWAVAETQGDHVAAQKHLRIAREFGNELVRYRGERMLASAVAAIDRSEPDARASIAAGHIAFREGQRAYGANKAAAAHEKFVWAVEAFEGGGSPVALLARYFMANTAYDCGRVTESVARLEELLATAPKEFPAHQAQLQWQLGRYYWLDGRWGDGLKTLHASVAGFERLGEWNYAANVRGILAEVYDRMGNAEAAWRERMIALRQLGRRMSPRLQIAISSITRLAIIKGDWAQAASFIELELDFAQQGRMPANLVEALLMRARVNERLGDIDTARDALAEARLEIRRLDDPAIASLLEASATAVEAILATSPRESIQLLTTVIASHRERGRKMLLPELLLERGRKYAATGDPRSAAADIETAIVELEAGRESLSAGKDRLGFFHSADELFEEAITQALARGDTTAAFTYAERARARQLLDTFGASWPSISPRDVPAGTAVIEYAALEKRLVTFVYDRGGILVNEQPIGRAALAKHAAAFSNAVRDGDEAAIRSVGAILHKALIEPFAATLSTKKQLVIVPDRHLASIAFPALSNSNGRFLIEEHILVVNPSAAVFARLAKRSRAADGATRTLVFANPLAESENVASLPAAELEAERIARLYRDVAVFKREQATAAAFRREAPSAAIIHFAGHATVGVGEDTALLLTRTAGDTWNADVESIASMRLTRTTAVVLAGCSTARGESRSSEGTLSLARAFLAAGVPTVVATLEPIEDEQASELFPRLHEFLARGLTPAEALRAVQLEWIHARGPRRWAWAAVELVGS